MTVGELLLELAGEALLDFVEAGEEGDGDEDDDGLLAVANFELGGFLVRCRFGGVGDRLTSRAETN